jgi:predicted RND superfamily exporter protein
VGPAKQLGALAAFGVAFAMLASLAFIPAVLSLLPPARALPVGRDASSRLERALERCAGVVSRRPRRILIVSLLVSSALGLGATRIVVDTNPMSFYERSEPIWRSTHLLNEHLGGWAGLSVVVEGDAEDPAVLREIDALEQHLAKHPQVGTTTSIAGVLRKLNQLMQGGDAAHDRVPETRELVAQYLLLYSLNGDPADFEKLVDFGHTHAQVLAKVTDSGTQAASDVVAYARDYLKERSASGTSVRFRVGGLLDVMADMVGHVVRGQVVSMGLAAVLVALIGS